MRRAQGRSFCPRRFIFSRSPAFSPSPERSLPNTMLQHAPEVPSGRIGPSRRGVGGRVGTAAKDADAKEIPVDTCLVRAAEGAPSALLDAQTARVAPRRGMVDNYALQALGMPGTEPLIRPSRTHGSWTARLAYPGGLWQRPSGRRSNAGARSTGRVPPTLSASTRRR
jgi:hypothetical protein